MHSVVRSRLEAARKELLDLGLRNPLINYRYPASKGVEIKDEDAAFILNQLVEEGKSFSFKPLLPGGSSDSVKKEAHENTRLQTAEAAEKLQTRLLNTYYAARTTIEEQGVNTLFVAAGMLQWYEAESSAELRRAPLLLVPVRLERSTVRDRFKISYTGEEVGTNLSLYAKLKLEFGIELPQLLEEEELDWKAYCKAAATAIGSQPRWQLEPDALVLGFFSFGKFLLYNDLDNDSWPADRPPSNHPLIQSLLGAGFQDPRPTVDETAFLDDVAATAGLLQAADADSSQVLAMLAVHEGRNLVIQGPPGTGKSQTITNIIANAIGQGQKVLFVAEKSAALDVVKNRLEALQLGEACLELHSHKASKKELHAELKRTLELGKPALQHLEQQVALLDQHREELNAYSKAVNTEIGNSRLTAHDVAGKLLQLSEQSNGIAKPALNFPDIATWDATRMQKAEAMAGRFEAALKEGIPPDQYAFWGSSLQVLLPGQAAEINSILAQALKATAALSETAQHIAAQATLPLPLHREACMKMATAFSLAATSPNLSSVNVLASGWEGARPTLEALIGQGEELARLHATYNQALLPEAWHSPLLPLKAAFVAHGKKWYRFLISDYKKAAKQLADYCVVPPRNVAERLALVDAILEAQRLNSELKEQHNFARAFWGDAWKGAESDWPLLRAVLTYMCEVSAQIKNGAIPPEILQVLQKKELRKQAGEWSAALLPLLNEHGSSIQALTQAIHFSDQLRFPGSTLLHQPFSVQILLLKKWMEAPEKIHEVIEFNNLAELAVKERLQSLASLAAHWPYAKGHLKQALRQTWYHHLLETALHTFQALGQFSRMAHEAVIEQFRALDMRHLHYNRVKAALKHWEGLPPADAGGQINLLRNEFNKKSRHLPIRKLMIEAGLAIQAIKPVLMMSPLSIANFLPPGALQFDLVIFDEASQVRPVEALGAILRGKQLVVVGDSQQLPPTAFFDQLMHDEPLSEESITADLPSVLGLCDAQGAPSRMLRWHYRSRHESLIRLSNQEFYENRLVVFPTPGSRTGTGLVFHHLPQAFYDRGKSRTNIQEAAAVAQAVLMHLRSHPAQSLGVVAFSTAQRDAILDQMEALRRQHPDLEQWLQHQQTEPFFVKNLENVQGDERDVIFISVGYGRTEEGAISQFFGPVNAEGGEKRLNVLMTRARLRCEVFTNLTADDIDTSKSGSRGLSVLKSFLLFAQKGVLDGPKTGKRTSDSPFEDAVAARLTAAGYKVERQVGATGFFIDLAIVDPEQPGKYILGIECDGASYHSARSARDRDRLRQQVLEAMGWRIYRIWSTDWLRNPDAAFESLKTAIDAAWKEALHAGDDEDPVADTALIREPNRQAASGLEPYQVAQLPAAVAEAEMHQHPVGKLAKWVELVVRVEGPVHFEELARRMVEAAGITRVGPRIKDHLKLATRFAEGSGAIKQNGEFLYLNNSVQPLLRDRSKLPPSSRKWKYVAPEERAGVLYKVVKEAMSIEAEEAYPLVAKLLGFARVTEEMRNDILGLIGPMMAAGLLVQEGGLLKAAV